MIKSLKRAWLILTGRRAQGGSMLDYQVGRETVLVRVSDGTLWVHADCPISDEWLMQIYGVGKVIRH